MNKRIERNNANTLILMKIGAFYVKIIIGGGVWGELIWSVSYRNKRT